ncbi:hypothetical protein J6590_057574 [Homalodisca vitripennis]|nr:hypothetical protein J6590_057574 [Homalodisca vitripennis]
MANKLDAKEARRLEKIQSVLAAKFKRAEQDELKNFSNKNTISSNANETSANRNISITHDRPLTVSKARKLDELNRKLQSEFAQTHFKELEDVRENEKSTNQSPEPLGNNNIENWKHKRYVVKTLVRFQPQASDRRTFEDVDYDDEPEVQPQEQSMKQLMDSKVVTFGSLGARYLPKSNDKQFGIWYDENLEQPMIGSEPITFDYDDIILDGIKTTKISKRSNKDFKEEGKERNPEVKREPFSRIQMETRAYVSYADCTVVVMFFIVEEQ